jgi:hypothetical protein
MTVHQPPESVYGLFDKVLLLTAFGEVAYFGPADQAVKHLSTFYNNPKPDKYTSAEFLCKLAYFRSRYAEFFH